MKEYSEKSFCIDLISDYYKTSNPEEISQLIERDLNIRVTRNEVVDYLNYQEDYEKESRSIRMKDIFYE